MWDAGGRACSGQTESHEDLIQAAQQDRTVAWGLTRWRWAKEGPRLRGQEDGEWLPPGLSAHPCWRQRRARSLPQRAEQQVGPGKEKKLIDYFDKLFTEA